MKFKKSDSKFFAAGIAAGIILCLFFGSVSDMASFRGEMRSEISKIKRQVQLNGCWLIAIMIDRGMLSVPHAAIFDMAVGLAMAEAAKLEAENAK